MKAITALKARAWVVLLVFWNALLGGALIVGGRETFGVAFYVALCLIGVGSLYVRSNATMQGALYGRLHPARLVQIRKDLLYWGLAFLSALAILVGVLVFARLETQPGWF